MHHFDTSSLVTFLLEKLILVFYKGYIDILNKLVEQIVRFS